MQFDRVMSMMRYWPAKGTAGLARSRVSGKRRSPAPPASRTPSVSLIFLFPQGWSVWTLSPSDAQSKVRVQRETRVYHAEVDFVSCGQEGRTAATAGGSAGPEGGSEKLGFRGVVGLVNTDAQRLQK